MTDLTAPPDALPRMLDTVATDPTLSQGEKVTLSAALRLLNARPELVVKITQELLAMPAEKLTADLMARVEADLAEVVRVRMAGVPAARPHRTGKCVARCDDCATLAACWLPAGAPPARPAGE